MASYDVIVIGTGGVGGAALYHLAKRNVRVLGIDRFPPGHDRGSSHGQTRIIRQAYFEHPDYVPLVQHAYGQWRELEEDASEELMRLVGLLEVGPPDGVVVPGVLRSAAQYGLEVEQLSEKDVADRMPGFRLPEGAAAVYEPQAGYLLVENCVLAHIRVAQQIRAEARYGEPVRSWHTEADGVVVKTESETLTADRLIIAAGAWTNSLLSDLGIRLQVRKKHLHWFANHHPHYRPESSCPAFFYELSDGLFYGFPQIDELGVKVGEHSGGEVIDDPLLASHEVDPQDRQRVLDFLRKYLPGVTEAVTHHTVCLYTMTPDEHFIVDRHPEFPQVVFAGGLSGHGFKFTCALGQALVELTLDGETQLPIAPFRVDRETLRAAS